MIIMIIIMMIIINTKHIINDSINNCVYHDYCNNNDTINNSTHHY